MPTEKQLAANRLNSQKSTGPKTKTGKELVRFNALQHGLRAVLPILPGEDPAEYLQFRRELKREFQPKTGAESEQVGQICSCYWRLRRTSRVEYAIHEVAETRCTLKVVTDLYALMIWGQKGRAVPDSVDLTTEKKPNVAEFTQAKACETLENLDRLHPGAIRSAFIQPELGQLYGNEAKIQKQLTNALYLLERMQRNRRAREQEEAKRKV